MNRVAAIVSVPAVLLAGVFAGAFVVYKVPPQTFAQVSHEPAATSTPVRILFVGDMMFDRSIRTAGDKFGTDYVFSCIDSLLFRSDFVVGNLEGPITSHASVSQGSVVGSEENYVFTFPTTTAATLFAHNVRAVNIGNNHIYNFGLSGILSTQQFLTDANIGYFGGIRGDESVYRTTFKGVNFSFVGYNEFGGSSPHDVAQVVSKERAQGRVVVVFAHWGDEYMDTSDRLRPTATLFAQSGASLIVGSHPHIVLPHEYIGDTLVYYSLGNFIFDQYWTSSVQDGLAVLVDFSQGAVKATEYPVELEKNGTTCPLASE